MQFVFGCAWMKSLNMYPEDPVVLGSCWFFFFFWKHCLFFFFFNKTWLLMIKQQHMIFTRHGQRKRTRSMPMLMFETRHFPFKCLQLHNSPLLKFLAQQKHPLTSKHHCGKRNTESVLQEKQGQWEISLGQDCRS